jgi:hypothetical protein
MTGRKRPRSPLGRTAAQLSSLRLQVKQANSPRGNQAPIAPRAATPAPPVRVASVEAAKLLAHAAEDLSHGDRDQVAAYLLRCAFTMFLPSVEILPARTLTRAVSEGNLAITWAVMSRELALPDTGIFSSTAALPLDDAAKQALIDADACDWSCVDLSIFGELVESAFDPKQRHRLGAHYTPREYVMRLVGPTIEEPLRREWDTRPIRQGETEQWMRDYHAKLCAQRVLDPACGSGNFLIVALETLYGIEDDVLREFDALGIPRPDARVSPHQMRGIEINPRACEIAKLVLNLSSLRRRRQLGASDAA